jgi:hypothetical protein
MARFLMPERRRGFRIVTLKNFGVFILIVMGLFAAVELVERARRPQPGDYGRIIGRQLPQQPVMATRAPEAVTEGAITDQTAADPMLVAPAVRSQYLGSPKLPMSPSAQRSAADQPSAAVVSRDAHGVAIVGDGQEVGIVIGKSGSPKPPQLSGGIFKP